MSLIKLILSLNLIILLMSKSLKEFEDYAIIK